MAVALALEALALTGPPRLIKNGGVIVWDEAQHALATAIGGLESKNRLDRIAAGSGNLTRLRPLRIDHEPTRPSAADMRLQQRHDLLSATHRLNIPTQRQYIAPMTFMVKKRFDGQPITGRERALKLRQPARRYVRD